MDEQQKLKILAVDDEQSSLNAIFRTLRRQYDVIQSLNGNSALEVLKSQKVGLILADQRMPGMSGVDLFQKALEIQPDAMRILITGYTDVEATIQAINDAQIFYYIHKPWEPDELRIIVQRAIEQYHLRLENRRLMNELQAANQKLTEENTILHEQIGKEYSFDNIIGESAAMRQVFSLLKKAIPSDVTVLINGETGTGKELIARAIHHNGPRADQMFVAQNCGALPDTLLESELFGHVRGAFTGATGDKKGLFELADGGTVFLDEIGDTSPAMQQRLLRVLQEGEIHPVGSEKTIKVDVRIVSAANRSLPEAIADGTFRQDLYYRLNVFPISLPPLRDRREDIPLLVDYFLQKFTSKSGKRIAGIEPGALSMLMGGDFPGNVRQLENLMERAVTLAEPDGMIDTSVLGTDMDSSGADGRPNFMDFQAGEQTLKEITEAMERFYIDQTLKEYRGNISKAAKKLGLSRLGLHKKLQRYEMDSTIYKRR